MNTHTTLNQRTRYTTQQLFVWTLAWLVSLALLAFGPQLVWDYAVPYTLLALVVNAILGIKMVITNKRHLDSLDELHRKIHFNAIAISLGSTLVFGAAYGLLKDIQLIDVEPGVSGVLVVMAISYLVSVFFGQRAYA